MTAGGKKPPPGGPPESLPQDEDLELWRHVTREVKPQRGREKPAKQAGAAPPEQPVREPSTPRRPPVRPRQEPPQPRVPDITPGARADVDKRTAERLKRGKLPIEGRLDLHGHRQDEARAELAHFLAEAQADGKRCVLVITGKGEGREGGVLRQSLPGWLNQAPNRARLVAITVAQPKDGGHGAFYLLLKRPRR